MARISLTGEYMPKRVSSLSIEKYRSIREPIQIIFPTDRPLILLGENNAGKSNIVRALDLILGEFWPGNHSPEDHEFWGRDSTNGPIRVSLGVEGIFDAENQLITEFRWQCSGGNNRTDFKAAYQNGSDRWMNSQIRDQLTTITITADRRLSYQMSYTSKWTLLSKLMKKFHRHLTDDADRVTRLQNKFTEIKEIFQEVSEFAGFQSSLQTEFDQMLSGMTYRLGIDFSAYDPSNYFQSLKVYPSENDEPRNFEELGTGQEQVLAIAFAHAYAKAFYGGIILIIEEPEAHLHPLAQKWLGKKIHEMSSDGLQIVISTHSPAMLDISGLEGFVKTSKNENRTSTFQMGKRMLVERLQRTGARTSEESVLPFYAWSSTQEILAGFFAKKIVLVEGETERLVLPIYMNKVAMDCEKEGVAFISVLGKGNLAKWWRLFNAFNYPVYIIFDNDAKEDEDGVRRRDALRTVGLNDDLAIEDLISRQDWIVEDNYFIFGGNFEQIMNLSFSEYAALEIEAKSLFGKSKPLVARHVAEKITFQESDNAGIAQLMHLSKVILSLFPSTNG